MCKDLLAWTKQLIVQIDEGLAMDGVSLKGNELSRLKNKSKPDDQTPLSWIPW
jgi:hypothetical protein